VNTSIFDHQKLQCVPVLQLIIFLREKLTH
jgi:hypothetical protein